MTTPEHDDELLPAVEYERLLAESPEVAAGIDVFLADPRIERPEPRSKETGR